MKCKGNIAIAVVDMVEEHKEPPQGKVLLSSGVRLLI